MESKKNRLKDINKMIDNKFISDVFYRVYADLPLDTKEISWRESFVHEWCVLQNRIKQYYNLKPKFKKEMIK